MLRWSRAFGALLFALSCSPLLASDLSVDLAARRARLMERLAPDTLLVLLSAPARVYSGDVDYEYRQDSNLYYLTGMTQPDTILVLMPGNATTRELLFVSDRNPEREHWTGRLMSHDEAKARSGVSTVVSRREFNAFLGNMLSRRGHGATLTATDAATFFAALGTGRATLSVAMERASDGEPLTPIQALLRDLREKHVGYVVVDATPALTALRLVKTPYELQMLTTATAISADAQIAGMQAAAPDVFEYQVKAAIEAVHRSRGAVSWAYPSIVGSGPNATILHYADSNRQMKAGDLLLVDAAANFGYQAADLTRTYPVSGTFTPAQRDIYDLVLHAQQQTASIAQPGATLATLHERTVEVLKEGLLRLGLIADTTGSQYQMWFTHGVSHFVGLDVHDVGARTEPLQPGMTFTIEPGLYIRQSVLDQLPKTPENLALIARLQPAVTKYDNIGVRIEDTYVMDATGARSLSPTLAHSAAEIEAVMRTRPRTSSGNPRP